ncbi:hypothetical protein SGRI78S_07061 [Streptomyces griseus subsp. griseus]
MTAPAPFGPLQFQLVLLRRMADHQPGLVEEARLELSASIADMREANRRWQAMVRAPRGRGSLRRYRSVLGEPEAVLPRRVGDLECEALLWPVPLWPDLRFEVLAGPGGAVWNAWLVRAPGAAGPGAHLTGRAAPVVLHRGRGGPRLSPGPADGGQRSDPVVAGRHRSGHRRGADHGVHLGPVPAAASGPLS